MHDRREAIAAGSRVSHDGSPRRAVLVVGGYGSVGSRICRALGERGDLDVVVAGRNLIKAERLARSIGGRAVLIDLDDPRTWKQACHGIDWVVMCMDQEDLAFVAFLVAHGIHYADITANDAFLRGVEGLAPWRSAALVSLGLAPGLTNIMAAWCAARLDRIERIDIGLLFGLGDRHGDAAIDWMAGQVFDKHRDRRVAPMDFGFGEGRRTLHAVDFSDQHSLGRTLPVDAAWTGVAFESPLATAALFALGRVFAGSRLVRGVTTALFKRLRFGSSLCNASVRVSGWSKGEPVALSVHFSGTEEALVTARLAALQIGEFLAGPVAPGLYHVHQALDAEAVLEAVVARGIGEISFGPMETRVQPAS
ncbi:Saccharopine dehydrogenase NADP binding domain-containing protein [Pleomorphomonas diazotrophica]|nr:saccharopine dehydrogenase NADP-binding domain-containing protein [Pleomorphomonas diazotrophica]SFM90515.1 Saccharopine dehydrogenase NADP binding domain-containing protein [Pleomorphomonas diazotrophica]